MGVGKQHSTIILQFAKKKSELIWHWSLCGRGGSLARDGICEKASKARRLFLLLQPSTRMPWQGDSQDQDLRVLRDGGFVQPWARKDSDAWTQWNYLWIRLELRRPTSSDRSISRYPIENKIVVDYLYSLFFIHLLCKYTFTWHRVIGARWSFCRSYPSHQYRNWPSSLVMELLPHRLGKLCTTQYVSLLSYRPLFI